MAEKTHLGITIRSGTRRLLGKQGGYVSARIAARDEVLSGALASILCVGFGIYAAVKGTGHLWLDLLDLLLSPALGGYLRSRQTERAG